MTPEREEMLFSAHAGVLDRSHVARGRLEIGDGWFELLDSLLRTVASSVRQGHAPATKVSQVKEKFGVLVVRFDEPSNPLLNGLRLFAHEMSFRVCEICGAPGRLTPPPWLRTRCAAHMNQHVSAATRHEHEHEHEHADP